EFGLAHRRKRHAKMFSGEHIAKTNQGNVLWNTNPLREQYIGCANRDEIVHSLDRCYLRSLLEHLQGGLRSFLDCGARVKHQPIVFLDLVLTQRATITFESQLRRGRSRGAGEERDATVSQFEQMFRRG